MCFGLHQTALIFGPPCFFTRSFCQRLNSTVKLESGTIERNLLNPGSFGALSN